MLQTRFNPATGALEIASWTAGPWQCPVPAGATRLEGVGWALDPAIDPRSFRDLGLVVVDFVLLYEIRLPLVLKPSSEPLPQFRWIEDPAESYRLFQRAFADRWQQEGCDSTQWAELWTSSLVDRESSGVAYMADLPVGFILSEVLAADPVRGRFYRTFGLVPESHGQGLGLGLYRSSLQAAASAGATSARWVTLRSNARIHRLMKHLGAAVIDESPFWQGALPLAGGDAGVLEVAEATVQPV